VAIDRLGREKVAKRQIAFERREIDVARKPRRLGKGRQLAGKVEDAVDRGVEERFLAQAIARRKQLAACLVVDGKRKHPLEAVDTGRSEFLTGVKDSVGLARGAED